MKHRIIALTIAVAVVGIGIGVIIGYFSHPGNAVAPPTPDWVAKVESFFDDVTDEDVTTLVNGIQANNIRENLLYFADTPHMATSPRDVELANHIVTLWKSQLDEAYLTPFEVMHGFLSEDEAKPNIATVVDPSGQVHFTTRTSEIVYEEYMKNPETIVPYFNAYGPPGDVQGKLIYANYGSDDDFANLLSLGVIVNDTIALVKYGGGVGRGGKASIGSRYGVKGVLVFSDPAQYVVDGEIGYPDDSSLPGTGVQRGSALGDYGDPSTPNYPSTEYAYRVPLEDIKLFPPIPLQPIAYEDAEALLRDLGGHVAPSTWVTGLDVAEIHVGGGFAAPNDTREVHLVTNNRYNTTTTYNVIGLIRGSEEPDKYVMYGNHRDSWVYGAVDPSSGTSCMMEITRVLSEMMKSGWKPRRTIIFGSWGSEEFGLLGSTEWVEDNLQMLRNRAVSYINVDIAVFANQSFFARASPLFTQVLYDAANKVRNKFDSSKTLKDVWKENFPNSAGNDPLIGRLYTSSDYASFYQIHGITSADLSYRGNPDLDARYKISPYPTYHTAYDTFDYVDRFVDPGFIAHQYVASIAGSAIILLSDSLVIPFSPRDISAFVQSQISAAESNFQSKMEAQGISLEFLKTAGSDFQASVDNFQDYVNNDLDRTDPKQINSVNERLLSLEKCFIEPNGLPGQPNLRHVSGSPGTYDDQTGSFPGIQDAMFEIESDPDQAARWEIVKQQLALVTYKIFTAARYMKI